MDILDMRNDPVLHGLKQIQKLAIQDSQFDSLMDNKHNLVTEIFTGLKLLTVMVATQYPKELPEEEGEMSFEGRSPEFVLKHVARKNEIKQRIALHQQQNPTWTAPTMKYRSYLQLRTNPFP